MGCHQDLDFDGGIGFRLLVVDSFNVLELHTLQ